MDKLREKLAKIITKPMVWIVAGLIYGGMVLSDGFPPVFVVGMILWLFLAIWIHRPESFKTVPRDHMAEAIVEVDVLIERAGESISSVEKLELIQKTYNAKIGENK